MSEKDTSLHGRVEAYRQKLTQRIESFPRGKFYEDMVIGTVVQHSGIGIITEGDNELFCMITENLQPIHTKLAIAMHMGFDEVVINGLYGLSMVVGLSVDEQTTDGTLKLNLGYTNVRQNKPLQLGDQISAQTVFIEKRMSEKYAPDMGIVTMQVTGYRRGMYDPEREEFLTFERTGLVYTKVGFQKIESQK